ncbi:MAG: FAD-dependent oxidoreductase [Oligoflexia bacterium]|nr:FAD-dependent oxidoreductase [Oligoflexia bacterium]
MKRTISRSARTPLFALLQRCFKVAQTVSKCEDLSISQRLEHIQEVQFSRRQFLRTASASSLLLGANLLSACSSGSSNSLDLIDDPKIVIVGAGMAGLRAAYELQRAGHASRIYEASSRVGGRMYSRTGILAPQLVTELGGEFIDSTHDDMLALVAEFGLDLLDTQEAQEQPYNEAFFFDGRLYSEQEVIEAFSELAASIQADFDSTAEVVDFQNEGGAGQLDSMSISEYLDSRGATGFIRKLLEVAYVTEYGLDAGEQSCLNLIFLISPDTSTGFEIFGDSDERFKIKGGNERLIEELDQRLARPVLLEHRLEAITEVSSGYRLTFSKSGSGTVEVAADVVLLTLPFTMLRQVQLNVELPQVKLQAIEQLGYGTNSKLLVGYHSPIWRSQGLSGNFFTDLGFQSGWDNSRLQQAEHAAGLTLYFGGTPGVAVGQGTPSQRLAEFQSALEQLYPGTGEALNGKVSRFHWPTQEFTQGSYACYKPGQWTSIAGAEILPVAGIYFAGEHCSYDFQGYMNGAAETGRRAAEAILAALP